MAHGAGIALRCAGEKTEALRGEQLVQGLTTPNSGLLWTQHSFWSASPACLPITCTSTPLLYSWQPGPRKAGTPRSPQGLLSQGPPARCPFRVCPAMRGTEGRPTLSLLPSGKLSLDEGGSDTESLYEIEGLNKLIQFV